MDTTTRLLLQLPDPDPVTGDFLDVSVLNANFQKLDAEVGTSPILSTERPTSPYQGQEILETDTGKRFVWGGTKWLQTLLAGASFDSNIGIGTAPDANAARKLKTYWAGTMGGTSQVLLEQSGTPAGSRALSIKAGGEAIERWWIDFDGKMQWSDGVAGDVSLRRASANHLQTEDWFTSIRGATSDWAFGTYVTGEGNPRLVVKQDGGLNWGPGTATTDTNLYRSSVGNRLVTDDEFQVGQALRCLPPVGSGSQAIVFNHGYGLYVDNAGAGGANNRMWIDGPDGGEIVIGPRSGSSNFGSIRLRTSDTTASAANAYLDAGNTLYKSTSSIRYKVNVRDLDLDAQQLLSLRPVRFHDKKQHAKLGEDAPTHVGLIAEEVDALGLKEFVHYDAEGRPDGVQYERLAVALLPVVKDLLERVERLEAQAAR